VICAGITDDQAMGSDGEDDLPVLKRIEADLKSSTNTDISSPDGKQVDLFSEIHLNELKKLEKPEPRYPVSEARFDPYTFE